MSQEVFTYKVSSWDSSSTEIEAEDPLQAAELYAEWDTDTDYSNGRVLTVVSPHGAEVQVKVTACYDVTFEGVLHNGR